MKKIRAGFTMIELIFVIVIIGILASVAIPKLSANRDDAIAATCLHDVGQLISEISQAYSASESFSTWQTYTIDDNITNIRMDTLEGNGIANTSGEPVDNNAIFYICDSQTIFVALPYSSSNGYTLEIIPFPVAFVNSPASKKAATKLEAQYGGGSPFGGKIFKL